MGRAEARRGRRRSASGCAPIRSSKTKRKEGEEVQGGQRTIAVAGIPPQRPASRTQLRPGRRPSLETGQRAHPEEFARRTGNLKKPGEWRCSTCGDEEAWHGRFLVSARVERTHHHHALGGGRKEPIRSLYWQGVLLPPEAFDQAAGGMEDMTTWRARPAWSLMHALPPARPSECRARQHRRKHARRQSAALATSSRPCRARPSGHQHRRRGPPHARRRAACQRFKPRFAI